MAQKFKLHPNWRLMLADLHVAPRAVLRRAGLPDALLSSETPMLSASECFRFWDALEVEANEPEFPIRLAQAVTVESFDAVLFAALCSPDFNTGIARLAAYKKLIGPLRVEVEVGAIETCVAFSCEGRYTLPTSLGATEIAFVVELVRRATRTHIVPRAVMFQASPALPKAFEDYFGVPVQSGDRFALVLAAEDAQRPFLTENRDMWEVFEPHLRQRLDDLDASAAVQERVQAALLEMLPSGQTNIETVAQRLGLGHRTLQRRLRQEGTSFQTLLEHTREQLARHYLSNTDCPGAEISFLLGFAKPSSFYRAFHRWTGTTPESFRTVARGDT